MSIESSGEINLLTLNDYMPSRLIFIDIILIQIPKSLKNVIKFYYDSKLIQQVLVGMVYLEIAKSSLKPSADSIQTQPKVIFQFLWS